MKTLISLHYDPHYNQHLKKYVNQLYEPCDLIYEHAFQNKI
jgi:hypothetical protein